MANVYDVGDKVRLTNTFTDTDGNAADPTAIAAAVKDPEGTTTQFDYAGTITKSSTGVYYIDVTIDDEGTWSYRWEGTGAVVAAVEGTFVARRQTVTVT